MTKEIIIITLIILVIYLYYQQNTQPNISDNSSQIQELKSQLNHYQTLYQKRVAKDLEADQSTQIQQLTLTNQQLESNLSGAKEKNNLFQQKVGDLETQLLNLAKQKVKGKKEAVKVLRNLEQNYQTKETELKNNFAQLQEQWKTSAQQEQEGFSQKYNTLQKTCQTLEKEKAQIQENLTQELKSLKAQQANYLKDISQKERTIIGLNESYEKLETKKTQIEKELKEEKQATQQKLFKQKNQLLAQTHQSEQEKLRSINILFDENAQYYKTIEFDGLYQLLINKKKNNKNLLNKLDGFLEKL